MTDLLVAFSAAVSGVICAYSSLKRCFLKFRPVTLDASFAFSLMHMISENAGQADHFQLLPSLLARGMQIRSASLSIVRCLIATPEVLQEASFPQGPAPQEALAWCGSAIAQMAFGSATIHSADRIGGGAAQHWAVSPVSGQVYLFGRFDLSGAEEQSLTPLLDSLVVHAARVVGASLFWHDNPMTLGAPLNRLTPREWDVLKAIHCADPEKLIAERLDVSPHTFHVHIKKIYRKLDVRSRLSLIELCRSVENERMVSAMASAPVAREEQVLCPA